MGKAREGRTSQSPHSVATEGQEIAGSRPARRVGGSHGRCLVGAPTGTEYALSGL